MVTGFLKKKSHFGSVCHCKMSSFFLSCFICCWSLDGLYSTDWSPSCVCRSDRPHRNAHHVEKISFGKPPMQRFHTSTKGAHELSRLRYIVIIMFRLVIFLKLHFSKNLYLSMCDLFELWKSATFVFTREAGISKQCK